MKGIKIIKKSVVLMFGLMTLSSISNNVLAETFVRSDEMGGKQGLYPESGEVFKSNVFTFEEGKTYKFSDFVKEKDSLGSLIVSGCGMNSTYVSDSRDRLGQSMYSGGDLARPLHEYADILLFDYSKSAIESGYVTFVKGSKKYCDGTNVLLAELNNGTKDKMFYRIVESESVSNNIDNNVKGKFDSVVQVEKTSYDGVKENCTNIDMKVLQDVKGLLTASSVSSGISAVSSLVGTGVGIAGIANNKKGNKSNLNKKLDIASTITSSISTVSSGVSTATSAVAIKKFEELMKKIEKCKNSANSL